MKIPTWSEFKSKTSHFEKEAVKTIDNIKDNHPLLDRTIQSMIGNLVPPPINSIVLDIYNVSEGETPEEKFGDVMGYLKTLEFKGERHYEKTIEKLDEIIGANECLKEINDEQITLLKKILTSQGIHQQTLIDKLDSITNTICKIETRLDRLEVGTTPDLDKHAVIPKSLITHLDKLTEENEELKNRPQEHIEMLFKIATAYFYGDETEKMFGIYESVLTIDPKNVIAMMGIGIFYSEKKEYNKAINYFDKAIEINPNFHNVWYNRGVSLYGLKKYEEAVVSYDKTIRINPDDDKAWNNRGSALAQIKQYDQAIISFEKALKINPNHPLANENLERAKMDWKIQ